METHIKLTHLDFDTLKVGDRVECLLNGKGVIGSIDSDNYFKYFVKFDNDNTMLYSKVGEVHKHGHLMLYKSVDSHMPKQEISARELTTTALKSIVAICAMYIIYLITLKY